MKSETLRALQAARAAKSPTVLVTRLTDGAQKLVVDGAERAGDLELGPALNEAMAQALQDDRSLTVEDAGARYFVQIFNPPRRLLLVGAVHIAQFLAPMGSLAGYAVSIIDPRAAFATDDRFPGIDLVEDWPDDAMDELQPDRRTAIVTLTHDPKLDDPALIKALKSDAFYIGALGSRRTHARRVERLTGEHGFTQADISRIHAPVGLDIGAVSPAEIAVSVMGEITQILHARPEAKAA